MRALKALLTAIFTVLAILGGLLLTAIVAGVSVLFLLGRRVLGRAPLSPARAGRPESAAPVRSDVIEVTATEVPSDGSPR